MQTGMRVSPHLFAGQMMTCVLCRRKEKSDPKVDSGWRAVEADDVIWYACPNEFPVGDACAEVYKDAYLKVLTRIGELRDDQTLCHYLDGRAACLNKGVYSPVIEFLPPRGLVNVKPIDVPLGLKFCVLHRGLVTLKSLHTPEALQVIRQYLAGRELPFPPQAKAARLKFVTIQ